MSRFFLAWSQNHSSTPINTQTFAIDGRQERQWGWYPDDNVRAFARNNPGRLYIVGDEPDQYCMSGADYAELYHAFVVGVQEVDPTARFSPAGFAEPNYKCCPLPDDVPWSCWYEKHSVLFAEQFWQAYIQRYGRAPKVDEWRFHDFGLRFGPGDINGWWERISFLAGWSVDHGANMVLGAWGFHSWHESDAVYQEHIKQAMGRILADTRINGAVYWSYEQWAGEINYLQHPDGSLTPAGQTYANPLTDVPVSVSMVGVSNGRAKVQWANTTSAWGAEVEYWVKAPGSDSFVASYIERVPALGAAQTPVDAFRIGDTMKARVRYYTALGSGSWSGFSNPVAMSRTEQVNKPSTPRYCSLTIGSC
ncbi:MAG TPA: hypothetical protein VF042_14370 [Gemmatimonadaceae bacterium]